MTDPFILKALFSALIIAVGLALALHSRRSRLADKTSATPTGEAPAA